MKNLFDCFTIMKNSFDCFTHTYIYTYMRFYFI